MPVGNVGEFVNRLNNKLGVWPLWFCPLKNYGAPGPIFGVPLNNGDYCNVGAYGIPRRKVWRPNPLLLVALLLLSIRRRFAVVAAGSSCTTLTWSRDRCLTLRRTTSGWRWTCCSSTAAKFTIPTPTTPWRPFTLSFTTVTSTPSCVTSTKLTTRFPTSTTRS